MLRVQPRPELERIAADAALNETRTFGLDRAVEGLAVVALGIDIFEEIGRRQRRAPAIEREDDPPRIGLQGDPDQILGWDWSRRGLGEHGRGEEQSEHESDSGKHGSTLLALSRVRERVG